MHPTVYESAAVVVALLMLGSGCGDRDVAATPAESPSSEPASDAGQEPAMLRDARTPADRKQHLCSFPISEPVTEALYDVILTAEGDLSIDDVRVVGDGVHLVDAEGAVIVGNPGNVGRGMFVSWPWRDDVRGGRLPIDSATRTDLIGMGVRDGQNVVPLLRLHFSPDSQIRGLDIDYRWGEDGQAALFVPMDYTYARTKTGC